MAKYIHNLSGDIKTYEGREIPDGGYYLIPPPLYSEFATNQELISDIESGDILMSRDGSNDIETIENSLRCLSTEEYRVSMALDKDGVDQFVSGTSPVVIECDRVLWDLHEDFDISNNNFVIPADGVYSFDCQIKINNFSNLAAVELAIYRRGSPDDYWFIIDKKFTSGLSEIQLSGSTEFDFYKDEEYTLKIILYKVLPLIGVSCTVEGDDDFTAWGYSLRYLF